jgi:hypothetical protein
MSPVEISEDGILIELDQKFAMSALRSQIVIVKYTM